MKIERAAIHPCIGIARVGNSREAGAAGYFIGPETDGGPTLRRGDYKDAHGALRRQAARFRIYGYTADGEVVAELTPENSQIEWTVHLANKKAAWYEFHIAFDNPLASTVTSRRRNPQLVGAARAALVIDPGPRSIEGVNKEGKAFHFDSGRFMNAPVELGEIRTDEQGRLLVLGGFGKSHSVAGMPPLDFANNNGWCDDISDGPVDARVVIDGKPIRVDGAWVVVAPPNYAPGLRTVRTLYDLMYDLGSRPSWKWFGPDDQVYFSEHIQPIFERLSRLQWVNNGFASVFGAGAPYDAAALMTRLADNSAQNAEYRQQIFSRFRPPDVSRADASLWPYFYGDGVDAPDDKSSLSTISAVQYQRLKAWSVGAFKSDLQGVAGKPVAFDALPLAEQPSKLDRAALDDCLADAFHPGCELTWIVRARSLYSGPLRFRRRPAELPEQDYGDVLAKDVALGVSGPLNMSAAGDLTRWMALPWQTDTASCLSGYANFKTTDSLPTFWPARVPNQVLSDEDYKVLMDRTKPREERRRAFFRRKNWFRNFSDTDPIAAMVEQFYRLGIIEECAGPNDLPGIPPMVWVESCPGALAPMLPPTHKSAEGLPNGYLLRRLGSTSTTPDE
ncbi:LodA/GoxA family CTQ-dependent oxidase [Caballeronia sp. ATUFL_F1_KS39]|uniref:LodA/GoxA family CTQ-dependent oxidase n=1 Tax=Caballeronia sp. ATUFL_F1_KS39 TaxID=2921766 RepID=UPI002028F641|nr:LodA/GoxA family CTQ-dependent oxidase [Caballeronia sp. ATUFL_F1_KS39]